MNLLRTLETFCYKVTTLPQGTKFLKEGDTPCPTYVLLKGAVKVTAGGVEIGIFRKPGDTFGEMASIMDTPVSATVETIEDTDVYIVKDFQEFLTKNPAICLDLLRNSYDRLAQMNKGVNLMLKMIK